MKGFSGAQSEGGKTTKKTNKTRNLRIGKTILSGEKDGKGGDV